MRVNKIGLIKSIRDLIHVFVYKPPKTAKTSFSIYLSGKLSYDYSYMAQLFSKTQGLTIEKCVILEKIQRVKELILKDELTFAEIADKLLYSSLPHLCTQFKKTTGEKLSDFRGLGNL